MEITEFQREVLTLMFAQHIQKSLEAYYKNGKPLPTPEEYIERAKAVLNPFCESMGLEIDIAFDHNNKTMDATIRFLPREIDIKGIFVDE